jgi:hypothetical protein
MGLSDLYKPEAKLFEVDGVGYSIAIGLDDIAKLEKACQAGLFAIGEMLMQGHTSVLIQILSMTARRKTEVGYQPVEDLAEIGKLMRSGECSAALADALAAVGNALSGVTVSATPSETGPKPVSRRKTS